MNNLAEILFFLTVCFIACNDSQKAEEQPPNIIIIVADDLGYADMSIATLSDDVKTPNIDRIANIGARFTETYVNSPICNQSRTGIITGCYPQRLGSYWYGSEGLHDDRFITIPELLKQKNYATGYIGKIHYGRHDRDTSQRSFPLNHGFDYFFGHTSARKHYFHHKKEIEDAFLKTKKEHDKWGQSLRQGSLWENKSMLDTIDFLTKLIGEKSRNFIKKNKKTPFFLQIAFNAAHNFTHQLPEDYLKKNNLSGYHDWDPAVEDYYEWYKQGRFPNNEEGRAHFLGQVHYMDYEIGKILDQLEQGGLMENTMIFFISDNGGSTPIYANNHPLRGSKYLLYEGGIRVQLLAAFPKKYEGGKVFKNMVSAMDILPTICEEVELPIPSHVDGISILPLLNGENQKLKHEVLFWDTGHELAVRKGNWKLRKAFKDGHAQYEMVELELGEFLYNLKMDLGEQTNLIENNDSITKVLTDLYSEWKTRIQADSSRTGKQ